MAALRAILVAFTVFVTATFPLLVREIGPGSADGVARASWADTWRTSIRAADNAEFIPPPRSR